MEKLTKSSSCPNILLFKKLDMDKVIRADGEGDGAGTVKLNANALEFVPRAYKKGEENSSDSKNLAGKYPNPNAQEFVPRQKKEAWTQVNADFDEDLEDEPVNPWMEYQTFPIKVGNGFQMVMLNHSAYMFVPCLDSGNKEPASDDGEESASGTSSTDSHSFEELLQQCEDKRRAFNERRREQERQVALEAIKLVEQRRSRSPLLPNESLETSNPVIHLSRSPVRYTPKERTRVGYLRYAKRKRIERILGEMSEERKQLEQEEQHGQEEDTLVSSSPPELSPELPPGSPQGSSLGSPLGSPPLPPPQVTVKPARRYIPTAKEWDEHRRAKALAKREARQKGKSSSPIQESSIEIPLQIVGGDLVADQRPDAAPRDPSPRGDSTTLMPHNCDNRKFILRYTIQELRQMRLEFEDLKMHCLEEKFQGMGFLYN